MNFSRRAARWAETPSGLRYPEVTPAVLQAPHAQRSRTPSAGSPATSQPRGPTLGSLAGLPPAGRGVRAADLALSRPGLCTVTSPGPPAQGASRPEAAGTPPFSGLPLPFHSGFPEKRTPDTEEDGQAAPTVTGLTAHSLSGEL